MFGQPTDAAPLPWTWVDDQLRSAATYWVDAAGGGRPHARPVWGVWDGSIIHVSLGSPVLRRRLVRGSLATVHLDSGTDVVIAEGEVVDVIDGREAIQQYDAKYDWHYDVEQYGPFTAVAVQSVMAWRAAGRAGRDGFRQAGRWRLSAGR
jgi:hypothetical protein